MLDGRLVPACLVLAPEAQGRRVDTIEGVAQDEKLHPIQQKFLEHAALQCGICTPGIALAATAIARAEPDAGRARLRELLAGNLCRCTGYQLIIDALEAAMAAQSAAGKRT